MAVTGFSSLETDIRDPRKGILLMLLGIALFSLLNGTVKAQSEIFPLNQIILFRNGFALIPVLVMASSMGGLSGLRSERMGEQALLSVCFTAVLFGMFAAYSLMPLADVTAISFTQPLMILLLSVPLAGDRVRRSEWIAVIVGLAGVLLMVQPTGDGSWLGVGLAAGSTVFAALSLLMQRRLSKTEASIGIVFWTLSLSALITVPTLPLSWVTPTGPQLAGLVAMGLASGACQYLTVRALHHATAAQVAPINYTKMLWAIAIGYVWFGELPGMLIIIGTIIVMASTSIALRADRAAPPPAAP